MSIQTFQNTDITVLLDDLENAPYFDSLLVPYENTFYSIHYVGQNEFVFFERFGDDEDDAAICGAAEIVNRFGGRKIYHAIITDMIKRDLHEKYENDFKQKYALLGEEGSQGERSEPYLLDFGYLR